MKNTEHAKRIKELRNRRGFSQEELSEKSGLSLRTIQRIENGETEPRGDSLKKLALALEVSPDEIIDWQIQENNKLITTLNLSQLGFLAFPLLGILIPLIIWIGGKDKVKHMNTVGKSILNFQISWTLLLFAINFFIIIVMLVFLRQLGITVFLTGLVTISFYLYNLFMIINNTRSYSKKVEVNYRPAISFLI